MTSRLITPAQVRAARALLDWSQEELAKAAGVAISSVRDVEGSKRASDTQTVASIRMALSNGGVEFLPGSALEGFGVRMIAGRPHLLRRPTVITMWDGLPFHVEWEGKDIPVFVAREAIEDLGGLTGKPELQEYLEVFEKYRGVILNGVRKAVGNPENYDRQGHLHVQGRDIEELS